MIGLHLIIDSSLKHNINEERGRRILTELPPLIKMKILDGPHIVKGFPENPGWTGFVIIDKSHIAIHTFYKEKTISIDVFSCKTFNKSTVSNYLEKNLPLTKMNTQMLIRSEE